MTTFTQDELERRWQALRASAPSGQIAALVLRTGDGAHLTPERIELDPAGGARGDRWARGKEPDLEAQLSLIDARVVRAIAGDDPSWLHQPGDNIVADLDLGEEALPAGTRLRLGSAIVEITAKPHTGCSKFRSRLGDEALRWINAAPHRHRRLRGVFARVLVGGTVAVGDVVTRAG